VRKASSRDFSAQVAVMESQILRARKRLSASAPAHLRIRRARCRISTHCARAADQFLLGRRSAATAIYHFSRAALLTNWTHEIFIREEDEKDAASQLSCLQRRYYNIRSAFCIFYDGVVRRAFSSSSSEPEPQDHLITCAVVVVARVRWQTHLGH
jgi:hypothetical protein